MNFPISSRRKPTAASTSKHIMTAMEKIKSDGSDEQKQVLESEVEQAYLEKEIERMYDRLAKTGRDTAIVSDKLTRLKQRKKNGNKDDTFVGVEVFVALFFPTEDFVFSTLGAIVSGNFWSGCLCIMRRKL